MTGMMGLWLGSGTGCAFVGATVGCLRYSATPVVTAAMTTTGTAMATAMIALDDWGESAGGAVVVPGCAVIPPPPPPEGAGAGAVAGAVAGAWVVPPTTWTAALFSTNVMGTALPAERLDWKLEEATWDAMALASSGVSKTIVTVRTYPLTVRSLLLRATWETLMDMRPELMDRDVAILIRRVVMSLGVGVVSESY